MPYFVKKVKDGYNIYLKKSKKKVAHSKTLKNAKGYMWHASSGEIGKPTH